MFGQIITRTPVVVWALLAGLIALGLVQSRTRHISALQALMLPVMMLGLGMWSLAPAAVAAPLVALVWAKGLLLGFLGGKRTPLGATTAWLPEVKRFIIGGSWIPMAFILLVFGLRYGSSIATALHPEWRTAFSLQAPLAVVFGLVSGLSIGRTFTLLQLARPRAMAATMPAHA